MTNETLLLVGGLILILGGLLLLLKLRTAKPTDTFGKAARGQAFVLGIVLILGGLILLLKNF